MTEEKSDVVAKVEKRTLEPGEKYLSIKITGHDFVVAFKNKDKTKEDQPDYRSDGVAVWIREKQGEKQDGDAETL